MTPRILVLEDDPSLARLYTKIMHKAGYEVDTAHSLEQANQRITEIDYAVFICDMQVNGGNSSGLLRQRWQHLKQVGTRVIIVSGQEHYRMLMHDLDVDFFLSKPVSTHDIVNYIKRIIHDGGKNDTGQRSSAAPP